MEIKIVTITGADDNTNHSDMINISKDFPFVEWGILFSSSRQGSERYPSIEWVNELRDKIEKLGLMRTKFICSAHLCGEYAKNIITKGTPEKFRDESGIKHPILFWRQQLNFNSKNTEVNYDYLTSYFKGLGNNTIIQYNKSNLDLCNKIISDPLINKKGVHFLYDGSGGRGVLPGEWQGVTPNHFTGYAGGLNPDNLEESLININKAAGDNSIWIDTETGVRTDGKLDLKKVVKFLEISSKYTLKK
jgi:hypothetical protein